MARGKQQQNQPSATNAEEVRQQNAQSAAQGRNQAGQEFGKTEFSTETDAQEVRRQNQQSQQRKQQQSGQQQR